MPLPPPTKEKPIRLVLVEDHADFRESVSMVLEKRGGYQCVGGFSTMEDALEAFRAGLKTDLVLSDLGLPGMSGLDLIRQLRGQGRSLPILILTARGNWQDKVAGLEAGADDYMVKPFHKEEMRARLNALVRRSAGFISPQIQAGPYQLDLSRKELTIHQESVVLTHFEYSILEYLMRNSGQVVSKQQLMDQLYDDGEGDPNTLEVLVSRLRKKLDPDGELKPITTIRRQGYIFNLSCQ